MGYSSLLALMTSVYPSDKSMLCDLVQVRAVTLLVRLMESKLCLHCSLGKDRPYKPCFDVCVGFCER